MKNILVIILFISSVFANDISLKNAKDINYNESKNYVETVIQEQIGRDQTCLDEYILREQHIGKWLLWTPPLAIVGVPTSTVIGAYGALNLSALLGASGWDVLGWTIVGGVFTFGAGVITSLGITSTSAVKFYNNRQMLKLVVDSHQTSPDYPYNTLNKFYHKYRKAWPGDNMVTKDIFKEAIENYDQSGKLCNGEMRGTDLNYKLKYRIVRKWDLFNRIHADYGDPNL